MNKQSQDYAENMRSYRIKQISNTKWSELPSDLLYAIHELVTDYHERMNTDTSKTTRICPDCKSDRLILCRTCNLKLCGCGRTIVWSLEKGQKQLT